MAPSKAFARPPTLAPPGEAPAERPSSSTGGGKTGENPGSKECKHANVTTRGSTGHVNMKSCKACGKLLLKEKKEKPVFEVQSKSKQGNASGGCKHQDVSWSGTNGHVYMWTCKKCGACERTPRRPGMPRPVPGEAPLASINRPMVDTLEQWDKAKEILDMVRSTSRATRRDLRLQR